MDDNGNMQAERKEQTLFDHIVEIGKAHEKTGALPGAGFGQFLKSVDSHITPLCEKLRLNELQAVLLSDIVNLYEGRNVTIKEVAVFIDCKPVMLMRHMDELKGIENRNLIQVIDSPDWSGRHGLEFSVEMETLTALKNGSLPDNNTKDLSIDDFLTHTAKLCENRVQRKWHYNRTIEHMKKLLKHNAHLGLVKTLKSYNLTGDNELILLRFCHYLVDLGKDEMEFYHLEALYHDGMSRFRTAKQQLRSGTHILQQMGLIDGACADGFEDAEAFSLTDKAKSGLLFEIEDLLAKKTIHGITPHRTIGAKKMFYPEKTARQVAELTDLLQEEAFAQVQKRLSKEGMRTGFACLFSGGPGTGKTETAYQIARLTGRGVMQVDISATKSKWFGESEKKIKKLFTQYRSAVKHSEITPILLFNEADAVIGKRQNIGEDRDGPGQTENTIQNIILQEIENLDGILIATTNLARNMDKAFERRFLYKIEFEAPSREARSSIWQTLIPGLSHTELEALAGRFDFSGGQIENIARRRTVAEVVYGAPPSLEKLVEYCAEEARDDSVATRIGFCV